MSKIETVISNLKEAGQTLGSLHKFDNETSLDASNSISLGAFDNGPSSVTQKTMDTVLQKWEKLTINEKLYEAKETCRNVLGLDQSLDDFWDIIDSYHVDDDNFLALCHYNNKADFMNKSHQKLTNVRGVVIDVPKQQVMSFMSGYNEDLEIDSELLEVVEDGVTRYEVETTIEKFYNTEADGDAEQAKVTYGTRTFSENAKFYVGYEPVVVRFFKWNGIVFFSTHRRLMCNRISWGNGLNPDFETILRDLGGEHFLQGTDLFGPEETSPYTHTIMMVHDGTRLISSFNESRLFYIGVSRAAVESEVETLPLDPIATFGSRNENNPVPPMIPHKAIGVDMCNKVLFPNKYAQSTDDETYHYNEMRVVYDDQLVPVNVVCRKTNFADARLLAGNSVVVIDWDASIQQTRMFKLIGVNYKYRAQITMNDPNLYSQYIVGAQNAIKMSALEFKTLFPLYTDADGQTVNYDDFMVRRNIYDYVFQLVVSSSRKAQVREFPAQFRRDINRTAQKLLQADDEFLQSIKNKNTVNRISDIMSRANGQVKVTRGLLYNETGRGLYKLISDVKKV